MRLRSAANLLLVVFLAGCATAQPQDNDSGTDLSVSSDTLIARDFVSVMLQVPSLPPAGTTISLPARADDDSGFGDSLRAALMRSGYGVRTDIGFETDEKLLYTVEYEEHVESSLPQIQHIAAYQIAIDNVKFRRRYAVLSGGAALPLSPMLSSGVDSTNFLSDDTLFGLQNAPAMLHRGDESQLVSESSVSSGELNTLNIEGGQADGVKVQRVPLRESPTRNAPMNLSDTRNFRESGESNYSAVFTSYAVVDRKILEFANDSTALNEQAFEQMSLIMERFNSSTDVISVIGSSHGAGSYVGAQKDLALGRAGQVNKALIGQGIPQENIFTEASWSDEYFDEVLPRKGVVLSLLRLKPDS